MRKVIVQFGQSFYDLALQGYGSVEGIFLLSDDNPGLVQNWHDDPAPGTPVTFKSAPINTQVVQYYLDNNIIPATLEPEFILEPAIMALDYALDFPLS